MLSRAVLLAITLGLASTSCGHRPPYAPGQGPSTDELLDATAPQLPAIQVSAAKVVLNRLARGDLGFIAQAPGRFSGGVTFKGVEMVALAFHEEGYAMRSQSDDFVKTGYYEGPPPADCAVEALIGVPFDTAGLVSLVLGGAPVLPEPYEVETQKWSRKAGYEYLVLRNAQYFEELRFGWIDGGWRVVGGALWENAGGNKGRNLWTVEHRGVERTGSVYLPERTRVLSPGARRDNLVTIIYRERNLDPAFAKALDDDGAGEGGDEGAADEGGGADEGGADDWGDGGWENDDAAEGGWENDPAAEGDDEAAPDNRVVAEGDTAANGQLDFVGAEASAGAAPPSKVPAVFKLPSTGLPDRGDLCR
jgi:hypothetical protein